MGVSVVGGEYAFPEVLKTDFTEVVHDLSGRTEIAGATLQTEFISPTLIDSLPFPARLKRCGLLYDKFSGRNCIEVPR